MSTVQPDLFKFFKIKKIVKDNGSKNSKLLLSDRNDSSQIGQQRKKPNLSQNSGKVDLNEFKSIQSELPLPEEEIQEAIVTNISGESIAENLLPGTPERKTSDNEESEIPSRKRKRQQLEEENSKIVPLTPSDEEKIVSPVMPPEKEVVKHVQNAPISKKRLIMDGNTSKNQTKMNPEDIKRELGKCGRLDELRARLLKLNQCDKKLQAFRSQAFSKEETVLLPKNSILSPKKLTSSPKKFAMSPKKALACMQKKDLKNSPCKKALVLDGKVLTSPKMKELRLNHFSSLDIEVPLSPSKSPAKAITPVKSCQERFSHLAEPSSNQLLLPYRYQLVKEVFRAVDTVVSLLHNRQEVITFSKLKPAVQEMLRKTFSEKHLGQVKTVFPFAYFFAQEKIKSKKSNSYNAVSYELTVKPNLNYKKDVSASRNLMQDLDSAGTTSQKYRKMDSVVLVERRHLFHCALLDILKKHHREFLQSLDPPIVLEGPVRRWHPEFPLEEIAPPSPSSLPQVQESDVPETAKDVLSKAQSIFAVNNRMKEAVQSAVSANNAAAIPAASTSAIAQKNAATDTSNVTAALKGVSLSLLEKIRAREADKAAREMTRSVCASKELEMLSQLPEVVRVLRSAFVTERKAALPWDAVVKALVASHSGALSAGEADSLLKLLMKEVPDWCTSHKVRCGLYLKIDKKRQLTQITDQLQSLIRQKS